MSSVYLFCNNCREDWYCVNRYTVSLFLFHCSLNLVKHPFIFTLLPISKNVKNQCHSDHILSPGVRQCAIMLLSHQYVNVINVIMEISHCREFLICQNMSKTPESLYKPICLQGTEQYLARNETRNYVPLFLNTITVTRVTYYFFQQYSMLKMTDWTHPHWS